MVGKLIRCMYGTRDAGAIWENCNTTCINNMGYEQGAASPCCFKHPQWGVSVIVHGDDFTALGTAEGLDKYEAGMQKSFECRLKGRLGSASEEMRVLNRIVRITKVGLLYEADPRHAEMLITVFHLEDAKSVVTPGVKTDVNEHDADKIDADASDVIGQIDAELKCKVSRPSRVKFSPDATYHDVTPYACVYGRHPRTIHFDAHGNFVNATKCERNDPPEDGVEARNVMSPNARKSILERVLRNGAAWETPTAEILAKVGKNNNKKFAKACLGSKTAKSAERMETAGGELVGEAATMYLTLSARLLHLNMDRPEVSFAAKELCRHFAHPTWIAATCMGIPISGSH